MHKYFSRILKPFLHCKMHYIYLFSPFQFLHIYFARSTHSIFFLCNQSKPIILFGERKKKRAPDLQCSLAAPLVSSCGAWAENPAMPCWTFHYTELWDKKWVLFKVIEFVLIWNENEKIIHMCNYWMFSLIYKWNLKFHTSRNYYLIKFYLYAKQSDRSKILFTDQLCLTNNYLDYTQHFIHIHHQYYYYRIKSAIVILTVNPEGRGGARDHFSRCFGCSAFMPLIPWCLVYLCCAPILWVNMVLYERKNNFPLPF